jgi:hypothetical protein
LRPFATLCHYGGAKPCFGHLEKNALLAFTPGCFGPAHALVSKLSTLFRRRHAHLHFRASNLEHAALIARAKIIWVKNTPGQALLLCGIVPKMESLERPRKQDRVLRHSPGPPFAAPAICQGPFFVPY